MYPKEKIRFLVDAASTAKYSTKERAVCQAQGVKQSTKAGNLVRNEKYEILRSFLCCVQLAQLQDIRLGTNISKGNSWVQLVELNYSRNMLVYVFEPL
jgi:hypothetical protein